MVVIECPAVETFGPWVAGAGDATMERPSQPCNEDNETRTELQGADGPGMSMSSHAGRSNFEVIQEIDRRFGLVRVQYRGGSPISL